MLRIITKNRDRYRPLFCDVDFYLQNQHIFKMWKTKFQALSNVEKVQAWTFSLSCLRRPDDWFGGERKEAFRSIRSNSTNLTLVEIFDKTVVRVPPQFKNGYELKSALQFIRVKPLSEACLRSLCLLAEPEFPIVILNHIPKPRELLDYQLLGKRILTFNEDFEAWPASLNNERDFLSFVIHDLIHADHFFKDNKNTLGQLGFYHFIESIWAHKSLQDLCLDTRFKKGIEYIISDMNSHPLHLLKTLRAYLDQATRDSFDPKMIWESWISTWVSDKSSFNALQKINTQLFSDIDALAVEQLCIAFGHKKSLASKTGLL